MVAAVVTMIVFLGLGIVLVGWWPGRVVSAEMFGADSGGRARYIEALNDTRRTWAQVLGGLGFGFTALLAWMNYRLSRGRDVEDRFSRAMDLLARRDGTDVSLEARLGGIQLLARIAKDSAAHHWPAMEILATYIRQHAPKAMSGDEAEVIRPLRADVASALATIIARDQSRDGTGTLDLTETALAGAKLEKVDFYRIDLSHADLRQANLSGAMLFGIYCIGTDFSGAILSDADLSWAPFPGATMNGAYLNGARATWNILDWEPFYAASIVGVEIVKWSGEFEAVIAAVEETHAST